MIELSKIQKSLLQTLKAATQTVLLHRQLDTRSNLTRSIEWQYQKNSFVLLAFDYFEYVDTGRKPKARKVPVEELIPWLRENNIRPRGGQTYSSLAFAIQQAIYKTGIKGKNYTDDITETSLDLIADDISDEYSQQIVDEAVRIIETINEIQA